MNYLEKLKEYCNNFPRELEKESLIQIKKLKKQGFSNEWIFRAITHKEQSEWEKFGFGLLWVEHYQNQITNLLTAEHAQLADIDIDNLSWDSLLNDEECEPETKDCVETLSDLMARYGVS